MHACSPNAAVFMNSFDPTVVDGYDCSKHAYLESTEVDSAA